MSRKLLLTDLDNTLIDRVAVFRRWAEDFLQRHGFEESDVGWLEEQDGDGFADRTVFFEALRNRYALKDSISVLLQDFHERYPSFAVPPPPETFEALMRLREAGWRLGIVTNGPPSQAIVIDNAALTRFVDALCISEVVGLEKPDPAIFRLAAVMCDAEARGNWMVGDNPSDDIQGAVATEMRSCWINRGRVWTETAYHPTVTSGGFAEAVCSIMSGRSVSDPAV